MDSEPRIVSHLHRPNVASTGSQASPLSAPVSGSESPVEHVEKVGEKRDTSKLATSCCLRPTHYTRVGVYLYSKPSVVTEGRASYSSRHFTAAYRVDA